MTPELETRLSRHLTSEQWAALKAECLASGIPLVEESDEYGHIFLIAKYWFVLGWDAAKK